MLGYSGAAETKLPEISLASIMIVMGAGCDGIAHERSPQHRLLPQRGGLAARNPQPI